MSALDPRERDLVKCEDMRIHAERACEYLGDRTLEEFLDDHLIQAAVIRCVEVIGEAARLVSEDTRRRAPDIPWPLIVGMRHVLAHDYGTVVLDKVYEVVKSHLPELLMQLAPLIESLERDTGWQDGDGADG
ncbi:MAG: DUF86 domain-containing protein [Phycisphaerales bacterium]|nr:MAG: DUF86 domain-containing protein [Phycisphaerales bacterium]